MSGGVRTSNLPDLVLSTSDGKLADKLTPLPAFATMVQGTLPKLYLLCSSFRKLYCEWECARYA